MSKRLVATLALAGMTAVSPLAGAADDSKLMVDTKRLSMETAYKIAKGAIDACREKGIQIGVTVVDRGGDPQVVLRDVLAPDLTLTVSRKKAYTAMSFGVATSEMVGRFEGNYSVGKVDDLVISAGGLPIEAGGTPLGGVGVSGAPEGETDEECAQAGIDKVQADLEMAGF